MHSFESQLVAAAAANVEVAAGITTLSPQAQALETLLQQV